MTGRISGGCILSRISRLPSRAPVSDREGLPVMRGEEKWLIKNPSLVFSSATYSGVRRVSFFSLFLSSFHPWARHTWAHTPDRRRRGGQSWQNSGEKTKLSTSGSQSAHILLSRDIPLRNFSTRMCIMWSVLFLSASWWVKILITYQ